MVYGELESIFEMSEKLSKLSRAGVEREAFCPENRTSREVILHVFREFIAIAQSWVSQDMRWYGNADERGSCGMSCVVIVGVMRLTGTSCCFWGAAGLDVAGVRGFGGA